VVDADDWRAVEPQGDGTVDREIGMSACCELEAEVVKRLAEFRLGDEKTGSSTKIDPVPRFRVNPVLPAIPVE
jgi:hypothetical protein